MAKKRKTRRIPKAQGLADISKAEQCQWRVYGPVIGGDRWQNWEEWAQVYEGCREELLENIQARRERLLQEPRLAGQVKDEAPACERIFQAIQEGKDPDQVQGEIISGIRDPRNILEVSTHE